jgi:hypothetical protein
MLAYIVGHVDINSAAVLVSFFSMITIIGAIWFAKRRSRTEIDNDFELAKIKEKNSQALYDKKQDAANDETKYKLETDRLMKMGQVEQGLITSHKSNTKDENPKVFQDE